MLLVKLCLISISQVLIAVDYGVVRNIYQISHKMSLPTETYVGHALRFLMLYMCVSARGKRVDFTWKFHIQIHFGG